jgi:hypothetical protein
MRQRQRQQLIVTGQNGKLCISEIAVRGGLGIESSKMGLRRESRHARAPAPERRARRHARQGGRGLPTTARERTAMAFQSRKEQS